MALTREVSQPVRRQWHKEILDSPDGCWIELWVDYGRLHEIHIKQNMIPGCLCRCCIVPIVISVDQR